MLYDNSDYDILEGFFFNYPLKWEHLEKKNNKSSFA